MLDSIKKYPLRFNSPWLTQCPWLVAMITNGINQKVFGSAPILKTKKHSGAILMDGTNDLLSHSSLSVGRAESNMHFFFFAKYNCY